MLLSYFSGQDEGVYCSKQVSIAFENHYIASFLNIIKLDQKNQTIRFLVPSDLGKSLATAFIFHVVSLIFFCRIILQLQASKGHEEILSFLSSLELRID